MLKMQPQRNRLRSFGVFHSAYVMTQSLPPSSIDSAVSRPPGVSIGGGIFRVLAAAVLPTALAVGAAALLAQHQIEVVTLLDDQTLPQLVAAQHLNSNVSALTNYALQFQNVATVAERATLQERIDSRNAGIDRNLQELRRGAVEETPALRRLATARADLNAGVADMGTLTDAAVRNGEKLRLIVARLRTENVIGPDGARDAGLRELAALAGGAPSPLILRNIARQFEAAVAAMPDDNDIKRLKSLMLDAEGIVALKGKVLDAQQQQRFLVRRQADLSDQMTAAASALAADSEQALNKARAAAVDDAERLRWLLGGAVGLAVIAAVYGAQRLQRRIVKRLGALNEAVCPYIPANAAGGDELDRLAAGVRVMAALIDRQKEALAQPFHTDSLTGFIDRRQFFEQAAGMLNDLRHKGGEAALLLLDVDRPAALNEPPGFAAEDRALQGVAALLRRRCRDGRIPARLAGDHFGVLLPGASLGEAEIFAMRLRQSAADLRGDSAAQTASPSALPLLTLSIGVAALRDEDRSPEEALRRADEALRRAKQDGGNRVVLAQDFQ
jgi:diguanylate cyclase (GGDEF)-like protein